MPPPPPGWPGEDEGTTVRIDMCRDWVHQVMDLGQTNTGIPPILC
jgi:hypothetical protein